MPRRAQRAGAAGPSRLVVDQYCVTCHNAAAQDRRAGTRRRRRLRRPARRRGLGEGHPEGAGQHDAAGREPPARRGRRSTPLSAALEDALDRGRGGTPHPGRTRLAPVQPRRVRQRHSRPAGARRRRGGAPAAGRLELRVRQHRRHPRDLAAADGALRRRGRAHQRAGRGRPVAAGPASQMYRVSFDLPQDEHIDGLPIGTRGGTLVRHHFPLDGEYVIKLRLWKTSVGYIRGLQTEHDVEVSIDGRPVLQAPVGGASDYQMNVLNSGAAETALEARLARPDAGHRRAARRGRDLPGARRRRPHRPRGAAADDVRGRSAVHPRRAGDRERDHRRAVQPDRSRRHAEPPRHLHVQPTGAADESRRARGRSCRGWRGAPIGAR